MAENLNPGDKTAAEADYDKKFNKQAADDNAANADAKKLKEKEATPEADWKTITKKKKVKSDDSKGKFRFVGRRAGALRNGSAFAFIVGVVMLGVAYTSIFAPNIILVNIKEMYVNDLADATAALNTYYWKMMNYKIGMSQCGGGGDNSNPSGDIKCKLSTMSRSQKLAFEKNGFTVLGSKVREDMRDDGQPGNEQTESRYQVASILPPANANPLPIATGDMLYAYAQLSSAHKALVYSVFNPKSSFFADARFSQRLMSRYSLSQDMTAGGNTEAEVRQSFDTSLNNDSGGIGLEGGPSTSGGITLSSLSSPSILASYEAAGQVLTATTTTYTGLQCAWYSLGKAATNNAATAKARTIARFAMQYLTAADQIKVGTSNDIAINTLSSNLAQSTGGGYSGQNATDSSMYKSIVYGGLPIPSPYGFLYYLNTYDLIGALLPAWSQIMATSAAVGQASGVSGSLAMPPANLTGSDRNYCLDGETKASKEPIKEQKCQNAITASAPPGMQGTLDPLLRTGRATCPHPNYDQTDRTIEGEWVMTPSVKATALAFTPYISAIFSANTYAWANVLKLAFSSNTKGVAASDAIFAGTGELLGDMAMSRGMTPANAATMGVYLAQKEKTDKDYEDVARYNARKDPFDIYNKFSFMGSIVNSLSPTYQGKTPLFSLVANSFTLLGDGLKSLNPAAKAFYYLQPQIPTIDPTNPSTAALHAAGLAKYLLRLNCPDPEYLAIGIMADTACNVRYAMGKQELLADPSSVLDYMLKSHSDLTQKNIDELQQRAAKADQEGDQENVTRMLKSAQDAANKPQIDKKTGKAIEGSEYEKYLNYCVNRQDPWGRSGIAVIYRRLSNEESYKRTADKAKFTEEISSDDSGDPYETNPGMPYPSISEGASQDQDWYTGKKCLEQSEALTNFRAYTMMCSVDGSLSGAPDCTYNDNSAGNSYSNSFYTGNDILFISAK